MALVLRIVDAISPTANVLFDLNVAHAGAGGHLGRGDLALAVTALTESVDSGRFWQTTTNPEELGSRQVRIPIVVAGNTADDLAARIQALMVATRTNFYLAIQRHAAATPVWLRCFATVPQFGTVVSAAGAPTYAVGELATTSDPYAYGVLVDAGTFTPSQSPAAGGAWVIDVNGVLGDSPTPILARCSNATVAATAHGTLWAVRRRGTPSALTGIVREGESADSNAVFGGATVQTITADSALSGSSALRINYPSGSGAFAAWADIFWTPFGLAGAEAAGIYRLLVRLRRNGVNAGLEHLIRATHGPTSLEDTIWPASGVNTRVIDMGLLQVPTGQQAQLAAPLPAQQVQASDMKLTIWRSGTAGTGAGSVDIDWIAMIPADEDMGLTSQVGGTGTAGPWHILDGFAGTAYLADNDPVTVSTTTMVGMGAGQSIRHLGGIPRLRPGSNRIYVVHGLGPDVIWSLPNTSTWKIAYWPRYSWLG